LRHNPDDPERGGGTVSLFEIGPKEKTKEKAGEGLKPGFREMKWGDPPKEDMIVLSEEGDDRICMIKDDDLAAAGKAVDKIVYKYFQARLSEVMVEIPKASADAIFEHLVTTWGKPSRPNKFIEEFFWQNRSHGVESTGAFFNRNPATRAATLTIQSNYIRAKRNIALGKEPGKL
jgi:hypothetical protein